MSKLNKIDAAIRDYYQKKNLPVSSDLITAILYSVDSGGKRIRPLIFLDLLEGFGLELTPSHFDVAASLEMIHTGSLIHDDLPAMDDDDYRRGRLTNHKKFDEATAILAGDSLFLDPFDLLAQTELSAEIRVQLIQALSHSSGTFGMVGGQMLDMKGEGQELDLSQLAKIHVPLQVTRLGKSACQTDGGRGMPDNEKVMLTFRRFGISGDFVILVRIHKRCPAACQYLMGITLVRHVIDYLVRW